MTGTCGVEQGKPSDQEVLIMRACLFSSHLALLFSVLTISLAPKPALADEKAPLPLPPFKEPPPPPPPSEEVAAKPLPPGKPSRELYLHAPFVFWVVPPLGTYGYARAKVITNFSIFLLASRTTRLAGVDAGLGVSWVSERMSGIQASLVFNYVGAGATGLMVTEGLNVVRKEMTGLQAAVGMNFTGKRMRGLQAAVGLNLAGGMLTGIQTSVGMNCSGGLRGLQMSVGMNLSSRPAAGLQATVGANIVVGSMKGLQAATGLNLTKGDMVGLQAATGLNLVTGKLSGIQASSGYNHAGRINGAQIGLLNVGGSVEGLQLGLVNLAGSVSGAQIGLVNIAGRSKAPLGLLNLVKDGLHHLDVFYSDTAMANMALMLGGQNLYSILGVGIQPTHCRTRWLAGMGIGAYIPLPLRFFLNTDAMAWNVNDHEAWTHELNMLYQLRLLAGLRLHRRFAVFIGPTLNVLLTRKDKDDRIGPIKGKEVTPEGNRTKVRIWPGLVAGIRI